ncbi:cobalt ECF transporter T component CbiQ [Nigerium massiliense]|uniref:cobalt ECF transporter T component CbiQ n=1 Tax=Nigerium massiliense TaxID=1522317 RepID=UPI0005903E4E|nr:cobalt ECF transporter T component CbiQ [Nigerium massiliense]
MHVIAVDDAAWDSPWRSVRVGEKALLALGLVLTALLTPAWPGCVLVALASLGLAAGPARIDLRVLGVSIAAPMAFLVIGSASVALTVGDTVPDAWWSWGPLSLSAASVGRAADLFAHGVAGTLALLMLAMTTPMVDVLTSLRRFRVPDALIDVASLTYRLLFVVADTALGIRAAQQARLGDAAPARRRWANTASGAGALLVRAWDRARRLEDGLALRGFENVLTTLPARRDASVRFVAGSLVVLTAIWAVCLMAITSGWARGWAR